MHITIGVLSERSGVKVETIRYCERIGLMPVAPRTAGRHRLCGPDDVKRLVLIRRCRKLGSRSTRSAACKSLPTAGAVAERSGP